MNRKKTSRVRNRVRNRGGRERNQSNRIRTKPGKFERYQIRRDIRKQNQRKEDGINRDGKNRKKSIDIAIQYDSDLPDFITKNQSEILFSEPESPSASQSASQSACVKTSAVQFETGNSVEEAVRYAATAALKRYRIKACEVSVLFTDNDGIRELNREHRNKDSATDVLSFPQYTSLSEIKEIDFPYIGDIVISVEMAEMQAKEFCHSFQREISYLTVHSVLHLLGYDHLEERERFLMRHAEKEIMKFLGIFKDTGQRIKDKS